MTPATCLFSKCLYDKKAEADRVDAESPAPHGVGLLKAGRYRVTETSS
jgi:hypothetical protein